MNDNGNGKAPAIRIVSYESCVSRPVNGAARHSYTIHVDNQGQEQTYSIVGRSMEDVVKQLAYQVTDSSFPIKGFNGVTPEQGHTRYFTDRHTVATLCTIVDNKDIIKGKGRSDNDIFMSIAQATINAYIRAQQYRQEKVAV